MLDKTSATIALLAGLWASMSLFLTTTKELNELRDAVLTGRLRGDSIDLEHRRLVLRNDWLPLWGVFVFVCGAFAVIALLLSISCDGEAGSAPIVWCSRSASVIALVSGGVWIHFGRVDLRTMRGRVASAVPAGDVASSSEG